MWVKSEAVNLCVPQRRECHTILSHLQILYSFCSLFHHVLKPSRRSWYKVSFNVWALAARSKSCTLRNDESALILCSKKFLWKKLRATQIYNHKHKYLKGDWHDSAPYLYIASWLLAAGLTTTVLYLSLL